MGNDKDLKQLLRKKADENIARYKRRLTNGHCTLQEYESLVRFEERNVESGGLLYAERLSKALSPNPRWFH